jgi:hypothetical protein
MANPVLGTLYLLGWAADVPGADASKVTSNALAFLSYRLWACRRTLAVRYGPYK